jgi:hypothetical protein
MFKIFKTLFKKSTLKEKEKVLLEQVLIQLKLTAPQPFKWAKNFAVISNFEVALVLWSLL